MLAVLVAAASLPGVTVAHAAAFSCRVPRALLCEGCASQIAISLRRDGTCRVAFAPPLTAGASTPAISPQVDLSFQVEIPPPLARAIPPRSKAGSGARVSWLRPAPQSRCFVFNNQRYCE